METREMRYFVAVAEELNFGRAATRLSMAQPPLSRAIQQLERRLGTKLLERNNRSVALTPAGAVLLRESRAALLAVEAAERRTRRAGSAPDGITLACKAGMGGELLDKLLHTWSVEHPEIAVEMVLVGMGGSESALREGRADIALLHLPFDEIGLDFEVLGTEGRVAVFPPDHPFGKRRELTAEEVAGIPGLPLARWPLPDGSYPDGPGPEIHDQLQILHLVALGRACALISESCPTSINGRDLGVVPVPDAPPLTTAIAWPAHSRSGAVADLIRTATSL